MTRILVVLGAIALAVGLTAGTAAAASTATGTATVPADATIAAGHAAAATAAQAACAKSKKIKRARIVVGAGNLSVIYEFKCSEVATVATTPPTTAAPAGPIFTQSGTGTATTGSFKVPSSWDLAWSFDCSQSVINTGLFNVQIYDDYGQNSQPDLDNQGINQTGAGTSGVEHYHSGGNTKFLKVIGSCPWTVTVTKA